MTARLYTCADCPPDVVHTTGHIGPLRRYCHPHAAERNRLSTQAAGKRRRERQKDERAAAKTTKPAVVVVSDPMRDALILELDSIARGEAWEKHRASAGHTLEELVSDARLGIIEAVDKWDGSIPLPKFARARARVRILDGMRERDPVGRYRRYCRDNGLPEPDNPISLNVLLEHDAA